jgi:DNA polymerase V
LYDRIVDHDLLIRRLNITTNNIIGETVAQSKSKVPVQLDLFTDYDALAIDEEKRNAERDKERKMQEAIIAIKHKFGKNAILKGTSFSEGATARDRNNQIGGHKA